MKVEVTKASLGELNNRVGEADNVDIVLTDNILEYRAQDFQTYREELVKIADRIILAYRTGQKRIALNVLTDIFSLQPRICHEFLLFCKHCPCLHCEPDGELFKKATGDAFIPPWQYCEKAFIEYEVTRYIIVKLDLKLDVSDVDRILFEEYIDLLYGTDLGREL